MDFEAWWSDSHSFLGKVLAISKLSSEIAKDVVAHPLDPRHVVINITPISERRFLESLNGMEIILYLRRCGCCPIFCPSIQVQCMLRTDPQLSSSF